MNYEIKKVFVNSLKEFPDNPRVSNLEPIKISIEKHGQYRPLTVNKNTNEILTGNHTWLAMKELGIQQCDVMFVDVDEITAKKIVLVDNRANELATYDKEIMVDLLSEFMELGKLLGTGYSADEVDDIISAVEEVNITEFEEFTGGYALTEEEIAEVQERVSQPSDYKPKEKLQEVILALQKGVHNKYMNDLNIIQKHTGKTGTDALYEAVLNTAKDIEDGIGDRPSIFNKLFGK